MHYISQFLAMLKIKRDKVDRYCYTQSKEYIKGYKSACNDIVRLLEAYIDYILHKDYKQDNSNEGTKDDNKKELH